MKKAQQKWWFHQKYSSDNHHMTPQEFESIVDYDPFDSYGVHDQEDIYLTFANLNVEKQDEIQDFYDKYGPLGLIARSIEVYGRSSEDMQDILNSPNPEPILGVYWPEVEDSVLPLSVLPVPETKIREWEERYIDSGLKPSTTEIQKYAVEDIEAFKQEQKRFTGLLELQFAVNRGDVIKTKKALHDLGCVDYDDGSLILDMGITLLMNSLNNEGKKRAYQQLSYDRDKRKISQELQWKMDSLLTAFYLMFIQDSAEGKMAKKCANCNRLYNSGRPQTKYCSYSCQNKAKTRKYQEQIRKAQDMKKRGLGLDKIAMELGKELTQVKGWIEHGKDSGN